MLKKVVSMILTAAILLTCLSSAVSADSKTLLSKINTVNKYILDKYYTENSTNRRVSNITDGSGEVVVDYNYGGVVLLTGTFKTDAGEWVTVGFNPGGFPFIAVYGSYDGEDAGDVLKKLGKTWQDIFNGRYDFAKNEADVAWIYTDGNDYKNMDESKLKAIAANASGTDSFVTDAFKVSYERMPITPYLLIGYEKTPAKNDGNKVYASLAQIFERNMYYKSQTNEYTKNYSFKPASGSDTGAKSSGSAQKPAGTAAPAKSTAKPISVTIDGKPVKFDVPPTIMNGSTMVPFRQIFEALGAEVTWDGDTKTATGKKGDTTVSLKIGSRVGYINGKENKLDAPAANVGGRTMVPARFISESLGYVVNWDNASRTVVITTGK